MDATRSRGRESNTMNSVLINAILSHSPNFDILFESLCWQTETWPVTEQVEALTAFIEGLGCLLCDSERNQFTPTRKQSIIDKIECIIWKQCLPLLSRMSGETGGTRSWESTAAVCRLLGVCVPLCDEAVAGRVALVVLPSLQQPEEEPPHSLGKLSVEIASEVVAAVLPALSRDEQLTLTTLSTAMTCIKTLPDEFVSKITTHVLLTLFSCCSGETLNTVRCSILGDLKNWYSSERSAVVTERALLCLTVLSDHLLDPQGLSPSSSSSTLLSDPRHCPQFWMMIQDGLIHRDSLSRKRALYLLKRCVFLCEEQGVDCPSLLAEDKILFKWSPKRSTLLRKFWDDFVLVMETLEENQVHVVRPVLNRINSLVQATANENQGQGLFQPSWLLCVYQRMFQSENKTLMKEGVCHLLELQLLQQTTFAAASSQFIVGPFMDVLSETSLFHKSPGQSYGDCPELVAKLQVFLTNFFCTLQLEDRGRVLLQMIQHLSSKHWCAVPLLFLSEALSKLPPSPLLGTDGLAALSEVLRCTMITHQVLLRGAAQCFLLKTALCLLDVNNVTFHDIFAFLMHFRTDESLCRGTDLWNQVCAWLSKNEGNFKPLIMDRPGVCKSQVSLREYVRLAVHNFLQVPASTGQSEKLPDLREADKLARSILLCVDMEKTRPGAEIARTLESVLSPLLETLSRVSTNIYLPLRKSDKSLQLLLRLFQLRGTPWDQCVREDQEDDVMAAMERLIFDHVDPIQEFILRRLCGELQELFDVERAELYLCVMKQVTMFYSTQQHCSRFKHTYIPNIIKYSLKILQEPNHKVPSVAAQVAQVVAMASLSVACQLIEQQGTDIHSDTMCILKSLNDQFYSPVFSSQSNSALGNFNRRLLKPHIDTSSDEGEQGCMLKDWGRTAAYFMRNQWICLGFLIKTVGLPESIEPRSSDILKAALASCVEALGLLTNDLVLPLLTFMETVLPQLAPDEEALCVEAVTQTWGLVQGLSTNAHDFWPALHSFISMTFQHKLLALTDSQAPLLTAAMKQIATELMELSESKCGVFSVLLQHCCQTWLPDHQESSGLDDASFSSVFSYSNMLTEACVYGPVFRRDQRLIVDVQAYVEQLDEGCSANAVIAGDNRDEQFPRTCVLAFLSRLDSSNPLHERLMEELIVILLKKDENISKSKIRYYSNSLQHRVKNRIWQTLLLLLPKLKESFVSFLLNRVFEAGFCSNQASVKYLIEWTMILILVRYPQHMDSFWACFHMNQERTKTSICTFLSVLVHFSVIIPSLKDPAMHLVKAVGIILQWCFNHNFSVRLYALLALKRLWGLVEVRGEAGADGFQALSTVVMACLNQAEAMQNTGNANKNWIRIQEHFLFGAFDPIRDYSVETIFHTFPCLSGVAEDEWIPPRKFDKFSCFSENPTFPLRNPAPDLSQLQPGDWIQQDKSDEDKEERWTDVQKKITPWRLGIQDQDPELQLVSQKRVARLGKLHGALVVVASLIDKPTNLGGLCRTCEIFGASALVLDSLRHITDKHFQSLSVSSELWLPLVEVKPLELTDFLQVKKNEGYCIVGVEQTANSQSLQHYHFPEKTLLLLGNEREGIPANLLQLLDVCVEIPQQGIIRSLNVHVSAALLIWEYTRQHLTSGSNDRISRQP